MEAVTCGKLRKYVLCSISHPVRNQPEWPAKKRLKDGESRPIKYRITGPYYVVVFLVCND